MSEEQNPVPPNQETTPPATPSAPEETGKRPADPEKSEPVKAEVPSDAAVPSSPDDSREATPGEEPPAIATGNARYPEKSELESPKTEEKAPASGEPPSLSATPTSAEYNPHRILKELDKDSASASSEYNPPVTTMPPAVDPSAQMPSLSSGSTTTLPDELVSGAMRKLDDMIRQLKQVKSQG